MTKVKPAKVKAVPKDIKLRAKKQEINRLLEEGEALAVLELIGQERQQGTSEKKLAVEYPLALNGVIEQGQSLLAGNRPGQAGKLFRSVLNSLPESSDLLSNVILISGELESKIELCGKQLMEQGLIVYRAGQLDDAIEVWEQILAFDTQHQAGRKAIQTAKVQLTNLKRIKADK